MVRTCWYGQCGLGNEWTWRWWSVLLCVHLNMSQSFFSVHLPTGLCVYLSDWAEHCERTWNMQTQANLLGYWREEDWGPFITQEISYWKIRTQEPLQIKIQGTLCLILFHVILCSLLRQKILKNKKVCKEGKQVSCIIPEWWRWSSHDDDFNVMILQWSCLKRKKTGQRQAPLELRTSE